MAKISDDTEIAPGRTCQAWRDLRDKLFANIDDPSAGEGDWKKAFDEFFKARIDARFLKPIQAIQSMGTDKGEGFSMVALLCILIEFLEAFYQGKVFTTKREEVLQPNEYNSSKELFKDFLTSHAPFNSQFEGNSAAGFYDKVRCGLLHEAATKEASVIWKGGSGTPLIEKRSGSNIVVYRDALYSAVLEYIKHYRIELLRSKERKVNFIRKMDDICQLKHVYYFAYGALLKKDELKNTIKKFHDYQRAYLADYKFLFNKKGGDGTAKANIARNGAGVWGCYYEIDKSDLSKLRKREKGYALKKDLELKGSKNQRIRAYTFVAEKTMEGLRPDPKYRRLIIEGANEMQLPQDYIRTIESLGS